MNTTTTPAPPAGWYPDPRLPQLRFWNGHAWTNQVTAARRPSAA